MRLIPTLEAMIGVFCLMAAVALLSGCSTVPSSPPVHCPKLPSHTSLEESVLADELPKDGPVTQQWVVEYVKVRKTCAAQ